MKKIAATSPLLLLISFIRTSSQNPPPIPVVRYPIPNGIFNSGPTTIETVAIPNQFSISPKSIQPDCDGKDLHPPGEVIFGRKNRRPPPHVLKSSKVHPPHPRVEPPEISSTISPVTTSAGEGVFDVQPSSQPNDFSAGDIVPTSSEITPDIFSHENVPLVTPVITAMPAVEEEVSKPVTDIPAEHKSPEPIPHHPSESKLTLLKERLKHKLNHAKEEKHGGIISSVLHKKEEKEEHGSIISSVLHKKEEKEEHGSIISSILHKKEEEKHGSTGIISSILHKKEEEKHGKPKESLITSILHKIEKPEEGIVPSSSHKNEEEKHEGESIITSILHKKEEKKHDGASIITSILHKKHHDEKVSVGEQEHHDSHEPPKEEPSRISSLVHKIRHRSTSHKGSKLGGLASLIHKESEGSQFDVPTLHLPIHASSFLHKLSDQAR